MPTLPNLINNGKKTLRNENYGILLKFVLKNSYDKL